MMGEGRGRHEWQAAGKTSIHACIRQYSTPPSATPRSQNVSIGVICHTTSAVLPEHGYGIAPLSSACHDLIGLIVSLVFGARTRGVAEFELVFRSQKVYEVLATT